jgi:hypothetical protein
MVVTSFLLCSGCHINEIYAIEKTSETVFTTISGDHGVKTRGDDAGGLRRAQHEKAQNNSKNSS